MLPQVMMLSTTIGQAMHFGNCLQVHVLVSKFVLDVYL